MINSSCSTRDKRKFNEPPVEAINSSNFAGKRAVRPAVENLNQLWMKVRVGGCDGGGGEGFRTVCRLRQLSQLFRKFVIPYSFAALNNVHFTISSQTALSWATKQL